MVEIELIWLMGIMLAFSSWTAFQVYLINGRLSTVERAIIDHWNGNKKGVK